MTLPSFNDEKYVFIKLNYHTAQMTIEFVDDNEHSKKINGYAQSLNNVHQAVFVAKMETRIRLEPDLQEVGE
ncbi:MAG: hypothetical protein ACYTFW_01110 [Planctomycetota bacterium]|jgi:hypothetical protein